MQTQTKALTPVPFTPIMVDMSKLDAAEQRLASMIVDILNMGYQLGEFIRETTREKGSDDWIDAFASKQRIYSGDYIRKLGLIGVKRTPFTFLCLTPGMRGLSKLPLDDQKRYESTPVELLIANGETLMVDVQNLTKQQAAQIFDKDHIRTIPEQRAWIEAQKMKALIGLRPLKPAQGWEIKGNRLIVGDFEFTKSQLKKIIQSM